MKIIFLGSSQFSVESLDALIDAGHDVLAVVCQPDKPNKRGNKVEVSEVKKRALSYQIPVYQFAKISEESLTLKKLKPDLLVVVSYGQILSQGIIDVGSKGAINVHPSLLPKYRGASPIISSILNGDKKTGVTIMRVVKEVDAGDIILQKETPILDNETGGELSKRLSVIGAKMLVEVVNQIEMGQTREVKQDEKKATFTKMIKKGDGKIDFNRTGESIINQIRAFNPEPGAYFEYNNERIKIYRAEMLFLDRQGENGEIVCSDKNDLIIECKNGQISVKELQAPNSKILDIKSFLNGRKFEKGYKLK